MHNTNPVVKAKHSSELIGKTMDAFIDWMKKNNYSPGTMENKIRRMFHFGQYLHRRGIRSIHELEGVRGKKLLSTYRRYCKQRGFWHRSRGLKSYLHALKYTGLINGLASWDSLLSPSAQQYLIFLRRQDNLAESTIRLHICWVEKFLLFLGDKDNVSFIPTFDIADIDRFIEAEAIQLKHAPHRSFVHAIRGFIKFLYCSGEIPVDFSYLVTNPRRYRLQSLPRVLTWPEIHKVLDSVDCSTEKGLRNHGILLLLSTYGLRAGEVAQLKLEDIDWRTETIHIIQRKTNRDLWLPLTSQVGKSILEYLKHGRPCSKYREIFLKLCAPWMPLSSGSITYIVNQHIQLAGLDPPRRGARLLRHSFATHLLRQGVGLKHIGDILGHRNLESTHIYTKTATERLREVALEIPEGIKNE